MGFEQLNSPVKEERLTAVRAIGASCKEGVTQTEEVNNHVHSIYSFSPYSPSMIAVKAAPTRIPRIGFFRPSIALMKGS